MKFLKTPSILTSYRAIIFSAIVFFLILNILILYIYYNMQSLRELQLGPNVMAANLTLLYAKQLYILYIIQGIILIVFFLCILAYRYTDRRVVRPICELRDQAEKIAEGNYSVRNTVSVNNELGMLARTLNKMCIFVEKDLCERAHFAKILQQQEHLTITKMNEMLHDCQSADEAYSIIYLTAKELFPAFGGGLAVYDKASQSLETVRQWGEPHILKTYFAAQDCIAIRNKGLYIVEDPENATICNHYISSPTGGYINVPLIVREEIIGLLDLHSPGEITLSAQEEERAIAFSGNIKLALANINLRETLRYQAIRDGLTGLFNRRYLDETLPRELDRIKRAQQYLSIAILDIDRFKHFNDQFGHDAGDEVLKFIGNFFQQNIRAGDVACRYGGEEFVIILINADLEDALRRMEELCQQIKKIPLNFQGRLLPKITLSAGIATAPTHGSDAGKLLRAADNALYCAKKEGKDRVEVFAEPPVVSK